MAGVVVLEKPREIAARNDGKRVRLVFVSGFLGAGKTTALTAVAELLQGRGLRTGIITNDQAINLVDTITAAQTVSNVVEVAGGCFCCKFSDLAGAVNDLMTTEPDVLLCEPVGSCTDMIATVLNPFRLFYNRQFDIAPVSVLVDPARVREAMSEGVSQSFPSEVTYIFNKQLEEADVIVLNKVDTLAVGEAQALTEDIEARYGKPVILMSARENTGVEAWTDLLLEAAGENSLSSGAKPLQEINYDVYARGEAVLGWLNSTAAIEGIPAVRGDEMLRKLLSKIQEFCLQADAEIAHVKAAISWPSRTVFANLTSNRDIPWVRSGDSGDTRPSPDGSAILTLNARVHVAAGDLGAIAVNAINGSVSEFGGTASIMSIQSFSPSYPRPPYRIGTD